MSNWTEDDLISYLARSKGTLKIYSGARPATADTPLSGNTLLMTFGPVKPRKYRNQPTVGAGHAGDARMFASAKEARGAAAANTRVVAGEIIGWSPQPSFVIGPGEHGRDIRYLADRIEIVTGAESVDRVVRLPAGCMVVRVIDVKGHDTPNSRSKRAALRAIGLHVVIPE